MPSKCSVRAAEHKHFNTLEVIVINEELNRRLEKYLQSEEFELDTAELALDYRAQGLPVPPTEQLREEAIATARKWLNAVMICEVKGHLWTETSDPENGASELTCRRCGAIEHLQW